MEKYSYYVLITLLFTQITAFSFHLDRVILSTNDNPDYMQFWPIAAKAWQEIVGVRPTLALIAPEDVEVDTTYGDVIRFEPIEGIPTSFYAQCIRLLLPALFPNDGCIVADIDLMPLQKKFFFKKIVNIPDDNFIIYKNRAYWFYKPRVYMCYNAAKGSIFGEVFGATSYEDIPNIIRRWYQLGLGWSTDEKLIYQCLKAWHKRKTHVKKLGYTKHKKYRICRKKKLRYKAKKLQKGHYIEMNCPKPYESNKEKIDAIMGMAYLVAQRQS